jgi:hypothetical protein
MSYTRLGSDYIENYTPALSSDRAQHNKKTANVLREFLCKMKKNL